MNTLAKLSLVAVTLFTAAAARAEVVSGYVRSNGTSVAPYYRTPANGTPFDNLSYRGYPSQQPGYASPNTYSYGVRSGSGFSSGNGYRSFGTSDSSVATRLPSFGAFGEVGQTLPYRNQPFGSSALGE